MTHKSTSTNSIIRPYFSHSAMMMKLAKYDEVYKDDSLWENGASGKVFSEQGRLVLESIWNGLFCLGTQFPKNLYWRNEHLNQFIDAVKKLCAFPGMSRCFKLTDEVCERRKIVYEYWKSIKEHEVYQYTSHRNDTLSIQSILIITLLRNLKGDEALQQPPVLIDTFMYMNKDEIRKLNSEIEELIAKN